MYHEQNYVSLDISKKRVMILLNEFLDKMNAFEGILACIAWCIYECTCFIQAGGEIVEVQKVLVTLILYVMIQWWLHRDTLITMIQFLNCHYLWNQSIQIIV